MTTRSHPEMVSDMSRWSWTCAHIVCALLTAVSILISMKGSVRWKRCAICTRQNSVDWNGLGQWAPVHRQASRATFHG